MVWSVWNNPWSTQLSSLRPLSRWSMKCVFPESSDIPFPCQNTWTALAPFSLIKTTATQPHESLRKCILVAMCMELLGVAFLAVKMWLHVFHVACHVHSTNRLVSRISEPEHLSLVGANKQAWPRMPPTTHFQFVVYRLKYCMFWGLTFRLFTKNDPQILLDMYSSRISDPNSIYPFLSSNIWCAEV